MEGARGVGVGRHHEGCCAHGVPEVERHVCGLLLVHLLGSKGPMQRRAAPLCSSDVHHDYVLFAPPPTFLLLLPLLLTRVEFPCFVYDSEVAETNVPLLLGLGFRSVAFVLFWVLRFRFFFSLRFAVVAPSADCGRAVGGAGRKRGGGRGGAGRADVVLSVTPNGNGRGRERDGRDSFLVGLLLRRG